MEITTQTRHGGGKASHVKRIPFGWDTEWGKGRDSTEGHVLGDEGGRLAKKSLSRLDDGQL